MVPVVVELKKGGNTNLSKGSPGLNRISVMLGWDEKPEDASGDQFDLDISGFLLKAGDKVRSANDFCFYGNPVSAFGVVQHMGDNLTGKGEGDDEIINIELSLISDDINKIAIAATIHEAVERNQVFGQVKNAFIRIVNNETGYEIARYDLSEDASIDTAMIFGEIYRAGNEWKFRAIGQGFVGGLASLANYYGIVARYGANE